MRFVTRMKRRTELPDGDTMTLNIPWSHRPWEIFEVLADGSEEYLGHSQTQAAAFGSIRDIVRRRAFEAWTPPAVSVDGDGMIAFTVDADGLIWAPESVRSSAMRVLPDPDFAPRRSWPIPSHPTSEFVDAMTAVNLADGGTEDIRAWVTGQMHADLSGAPTEEERLVRVTDAVDWMFDRELVDIEQLLIVQLEQEGVAPC